MTESTKIELPARLENLYKFIDFATSYALQHGFADKILQNIDLCLEEALVNIFSYAYKNAEGKAAVECSFKEGKLFIQIIDWGSPFDPLIIHSPDVYANLAADRIGGYGIVLIKKLTDKVSYARTGDKNILTMVFVNHKDL